VLTGTEKARLDNREYVLGTYEEIEKYAEEQDTCVDRYLDHVNPSCVTSKFKYVGTSVNPYAVAKPIYINQSYEDKLGRQLYRFIGYRQFKEKF
tara:strand:- start:311 stop:592 length:282 start_codon:yes stop_codon:yes gene_type:complete